jgi:hypothetical protein
MLKLYADSDLKKKYVTWVRREFAEEDHFLQEHFDPALPIQQYNDPSFKDVIAKCQDEFKELWQQK